MSVGLGSVAAQVSRSSRARSVSSAIQTGEPRDDLGSPAHGRYAPSCARVSLSRRRIEGHYAAPGGDPSPV